jgi:hypothetical protein
LISHRIPDRGDAASPVHLAPGDADLPAGPFISAAALTLAWQSAGQDLGRQLLADVTGALVSDGFIRSCLARAASLARKHGQNAMDEVLHDLMLGRPWRPPAQALSP